jgi:hypothetical protein
MSKNANKVTLSTQVYEKHAALVKEAACKKGLNINTLVRTVLLQWASNELDQPMPDLEEYRTVSIVQSAARRMGLGVQEFMRLAAEEVAKVQMARLARE